MANSDQSNKSEHNDMIELLSFVVGGQDYAVDIMCVREIRSASSPTSLPRAPDYILGVINLRGTVLPVMDLSLRLGMNRSSCSERDVIIVVASGEKTMGLLVDAVSDILTLSSDELQDPPHIQVTTGQPSVAALAVANDRMSRILDLETVFTQGHEEAA